MRMMKKKIWIILLAALLAIEVLTACTPSTGPDPAKEPTASVEVPAGFELMDISALVKDQKIEIVTNGSKAEVKVDEENGGLLFSGTPSEIEKVEIRWKDDVDFGSVKAGLLVINAFCGNEGSASVKALLDGAHEVSVRAAVQQTADTSNGYLNNCSDISSNNLSGRHALSLHVDFEDGSANAPVSFMLKNVLFVANSLPVVELNIDESLGTIAAMNEDHDHKTRCYGNMTLHIPDGYKSEFMEEEGETQTFELDYIRGRGNTTWNAGKKPYKIKLKKKAGLLGLGENKQWGLIANYFDYALIRNRYTLWLGKQIGMEFTPQCTPVNVVMNGRYLGSYCLCELVQTGKNRVDIDELTEDVTEGEELTGGYLLSTYKDNPPESSFTISSVDEYVSQLSFDLESPDPDDFSVQEQYEYIKNYIQTVDEVICSEELCDKNGVSYREYIDVDSLINYYIIESMSENGDAFRNGSTYLYKKRGGKLYWGPLWDFDIAWRSSDYSSKDSGFFTDFVNFPWFRQLYEKDPEFKSTFLARVKEVDAIMKKSAAAGGKIDDFSREVYLSQKANHAVCPSIRDEKQEEMSGVTFDSEIERYKKLIAEIAGWHDENASQILVVYKQAIFMIGDNIQDAINFTDWPIDESQIPIPEVDGKTFIGWYHDSGDGKEVSINDYVPARNEREIYFTAKFEDGPSVPEKKSTVSIIPIAAGLAVVATAVTVYVLKKKKKQ
ncbi:MAG: CotH kinase family protein [Erysipelotrichaceae bacterium]|nr:CotH kinase family protein [Erysipelotrichaceae bacterium]